jgi:fatty-acyl-CoA synthase
LSKSPKTEATTGVFDPRPRDGLSYVVGDTEPGLWRKTIGQLLEETAARFPDNEAMVFCEYEFRMTYRELNREADKVAAGLYALGLRKGERIGIWAPNRPEWVILQFATAKVGLVLVNINPAYRLSELEFALNKVGCAAIVIADKFKSSDYIGMIRTLAPEIDAAEPGALQAKTVPALRMVIRMGAEKTAGMLNFDDVTRQGAESDVDLKAIGDSLDAEDAINIQFTSGTTGTPKGATLSHYNIVNNGRFVVDGMKFTDQDRLCIPVPMYHCFAMVMGSLGCATVGACMVFPSEAFEPLKTLEALDTERCTAMYGVPTMFVAMMDHPEFDRFDFSSMRTGCMAGSPCPVEYMNRAIGEMNMAEVISACGMTETSPVSMQCEVDAPIEMRVETVGRVQPHAEIKIVDADGAIVPVGEMGEILARGYLVMQGYWNDDERTNEAIEEDGYIHSGDLATMDENGYIKIVGRLKEMLIRGGENIYPREIEEFLHRHPKIGNVQVFGVPDDKYGEEVCAWIILKDGETATEQDIKEFCTDQIAHFKVPRYVRFVDDMPMTVTGKPQKFIMRDMMAEELASG